MTAPDVPPVHPPSSAVITHTLAALAAAGEPTKAQSYDRGVGTELNGSLIAPFAGIHGWFLQNEEDKPIIVRLKMSGFYELREPLLQFDLKALPATR